VCGCRNRAGYPVAMIRPEIHTPRVISLRVLGEPLRDERVEDDWPVVSQLIEMLDTIYRTDVSDADQYGDLDAHGHVIIL
jgi:hypothetical protein